MRFAALLPLLVAACAGSSPPGTTGEQGGSGGGLGGSGGSIATGGGGGAGGDGGSGGSGTLHIPDPGAVAITCSDTEPNDTPDQAVPCGIQDIGTGMYFDGTIGAGDGADYVVFATTSDQAMPQLFTSWTTGTNLLDMVLYKVLDGGTRIEEVVRFESNAPDFEGGVGMMPALKAGVYLLAILSKEGQGTYNV